MSDNREKAINLAPGKDIRDFKRRDEIPVSELTTEQRNFKRQTIIDHLEQLTECLHYAKQDEAAFFSSLNIQNPEKRAETERAVRDMEKEIECYKKKLSELNAG
jgi:hypothetical protein